MTGFREENNPFGSNILKSKAQSSFQGGFGDLQPFTYDNQTYTTRFIDLCVDENQAIFALDYTSGRVFQYDEEGNLLFVFGGIGNQKAFLSAGGGGKRGKHRLCAGRR